VGAVSAALIVLLADDGEPDVTWREALVQKAAASEAVAEIHRIFPLTHHHSRVEKAHFRRAMDRVRQLIELR
jgi:hypothetical protein